jgi:hypothetical protein
MIAPGVLATVAHVLYQEEGDSSPFQEDIRVMLAGIKAVELHSKKPG